MKKNKNKLCICIYLRKNNIGSLGVYASNLLLRTDQVQYTEDKTVQETIEELYKKADELGNKIFGHQINFMPSLIGTIYLDSTDLKNQCLESDAKVDTTDTVGCMKWYIYN